MNWWWLQSEVDSARREVGHLRNEVRRAKAAAAGPIEHRPGMFRLSFVMLLVFVEALGLALVTWLYTGSSKGLRMPLPDGTVLGGLHWDIGLALLASVAVFLVWCVAVFMIPVLGPMLNLAVSAFWGAITFGFSESIGLGVLVFLFSFIGRTAYQVARSRVMAIVEWTAVAAMALVCLAPFGADASGFGFGGWHALRLERDRHTCKHDMQAAHYDRLCTAIKARDRQNCEHEMQRSAASFNYDNRQVRAAVWACAQSKTRARSSAP